MRSGQRLDCGRHHEWREGLHEQSRPRDTADHTAIPHRAKHQKRQRAARDGHDAIGGAEADSEQGRQRKRNPVAKASIAKADTTSTTAPRAIHSGWVRPPPPA